MQSNKITLDRTIYRYLEWINPGKPKILLLHGLKVESHCWEDVAAILQKDYQVYALDLKGHGETERGKRHNPDYSLEQISKEIKDFHTQIIREPFHIAGYSLGGQFAMNYAAQYPETLKTLILIDTAPEISLMGLFFLVILGLAKNRIYETKEEVIQQFSKRGFEKIGKYVAHYTLIQRTDGKFEYKFDVRNIAPQTLSENMQRIRVLWEKLRKVQSRTLLMKAEKSQIISDSIVRKMRKALPGIELEIIKGHGHEMVFTAPDLVTQKIKEFIEKN